MWWMICIHKIKEWNNTLPVSHYLCNQDTCLIRTIQDRHLGVLIRQVVLYIFSYFGFKLKIFLSDCFLTWHAHSYGWEERIARKQDRPSLLIEHPLRAPQIAQNIHICLPFGSWKTVFQIVSPCCTYVSTVMRSAFADISVPLLPWILCKGPTWPRKKKKKNFILFIFFILTQKVLIILLLYLTCKLLLKRVDVNQDGPSLIIEPPPPPPPAPQIATDVNVFIWKTYYALLIVVVHLSPVWWGLHDTLVPLDSTYASPGPPQNGNKIMKNVHQITSIFYMLLRG